MKYCTIQGCIKPRDRHGLCQMHYWRLKHHSNPLYQPWKPRYCSVSKCKREHKGHGMCAFHLNRKKKGIPLDFEAPKLAKKRYVIKTLKEHPLADVTGRIAEHRVVLFDSIKFLRVPCYWCGAPLQFGANLCVDHLNHDRHDNSLQNLVPACNRCNAGRTINSRIRQSIYKKEDSYGVTLN